MQNDLLMDGYASQDGIYFTVGEHTGYARKLSETVIQGRFPGLPDYRPYRITETSKRYHAAEHKVFNCFKRKISKLKANAPISELAEKIPTVDEVKRYSDYSILCGTTIYLISGLLLLGSSLIGLLRVNHIFIALGIYIFSIVVAFLISSFIQKKYYLAQANSEDIDLAIRALKEALK